MTIDEEADRLIKGDFSHMVAGFARASFDVPTLRWEPDPDDIPIDLLRDLQSYWEAMPKALAREHGELPQAAALDPLEIGKLLGYLILVDVVDGGQDFRYRLYGTKIAEVSGFDSTGELVSQSRPHPINRALFQTVYRAVQKSGRPMYTAHKPCTSISTVSWHRLIMPLIDDTGEIVRLLVANVPTGTSQPYVPLGSRVH